MEMEAMIQEYLEYGTSKQLRRKTLHSYKQALVFWKEICFRNPFLKTIQSMASIGILIQGYKMTNSSFPFS